MNGDEEVEDIEEEILELEELIALQRQKIELLRRKHACSEKKGDDGGMKENRQSKGTVNPLQINSAKDDIPMVGAKRPSSIAQEQAPEPEPTPPPPPPPPMSSKSKQDTLISSMQRMSRLSTDLANERNLLAWGRTAMAAARTALAFLGLVGLTTFGDVAVYMTSIGFGVIAVWMVVQGAARYKAIKEILMLPEPPVNFDRLSNAPVHIVMVSLLILLIIGNAANQWSHQ